MANNKKTSLLLGASVCVALLSLVACDKKNDATAPAAAPQAAPAYIPPTADQLYQLVGPIALFPDKLVAQVLAASSYPDQVTAADNWLAQNKNLKGQPLQDAANQQPWDVSVKGLTQFPGVLDQMAHNIPWTSALGDAYVNDPTDVMNAIQVMRQRAAASGNLKSNKQQHIARAPRLQAAPPPGYAPPTNEPAYYTGPEMVPPPPETIVIEPADSGVVYVPAYNPAVVYGQPMPVYPGYSYAPPPDYYPPGDVVTAGVLTFGLGIAVGALIETHHWGWNSWGMHWGGGGGGGNWNGGGPNGWHRPAVVYNNNTYVSRSTTIINRVTNNYNNTVINNNTRNHFAAPNPALPGGGAANFNVNRPNFAAPGNPQQMHPQIGAAATPRGNHGPADFNNMTRPNFAAPGNPQQLHPGPNGASFAATPGGNHGPSDFSNMTRPNFNRNFAASGPAAAASTNQLPRPGAMHPVQNQAQFNGALQHPGRGEPAQNDRAMHELQQNASNHGPAAQHSPEGVRTPENLNQHAFGRNQQAAMQQPQPAPQHVQDRPHQQFNRPEGGQQFHQEMNRPAPEVHREPAPVRAEPRPEPRPQAQHQPQPRPQQEHPQQEHHDGDHRRPNDKEEKRN